MPIFGGAPASGVFAKWIRDSSTSHEDWTGGPSERRLNVIRRISHAADSELSRLRWGKKMVEVNKGRASPAAPVTSSTIKAILPPPAALSGNSTKEGAGDPSRQPAYGIYGKHPAVSRRYQYSKTSIR